MKKKIWLIAIMALLVTVFSIVGTYALFETEASGDGIMEIGKWKIYLNDVDISTANTITINDFAFSGNNHIQNGYFAPGSSATYVIEIDASESDVSIAYDLEIDDSALDDHPNIAFSITNLNTNQTITSNSYSGVIGVNDQNRVIELQISLTWTNNSLYDENDSELIGEDLEFLITADFEQYLGV